MTIPRAVARVRDFCNGAEQIWNAPEAFEIIQLSTWAWHRAAMGHSLETPTEGASFSESERQEESFVDALESLDVGELPSSSLDAGGWWTRVDVSDLQFSKEPWGKIFRKAVRDLAAAVDAAGASIQDIRPAAAPLPDSLVDFVLDRPPPPPHPPTASMDLSGLTDGIDWSVW